jgi:hypothetical protein
MIDDLSIDWIIGGIEPTFHYRTNGSFIEPMVHLSNQWFIHRINGSLVRALNPCIDDAVTTSMITSSIIDPQMYSVVEGRPLAERAGRAGTSVR